MEGRLVRRLRMEVRRHAIASVAGDPHLKLEGGEILTRKRLGTKLTAEKPQPAGAGKTKRTKRNRASASEAGDCDLKRNQASTSEGGEILRRKKEMFEVRLRANTRPEVPQPAGAEKTKRTKVVKTKVPQEFIDYIIATPSPLVDVLTDDELAKYNKHYREAYAITKAKSDKIRAWHLALIDQYNDQGYAEDETEVTDDEEEMMEN